MQNHYKTLGLQYGASKDEIKRAFRKLASIYHPDKSTGNEERYKEITQAYSALMKQVQKSPDIVWGPSIHDIMRQQQRMTQEQMRRYSDSLRKQQKAKNFEDILKNI